MYSEYPIWSVEDARAGVYKRGSIVIYSPDNVLRYIYIATEDYEGSLLPPSVAVGWAYLDTIVDDWQSGKVYKIGNVVRFNSILYVATRRYRDGTAPPNEELDPDGIRTWMLSYEDGKTPVTPFFYRKTFGYKSLDEVYPFGNYLEDISLQTVPARDGGSYENEVYEYWDYDRFKAFRTLPAYDSIDNWKRQKEQSLINSVMEAHPYHDIYVFGYQPSGPPLPSPQKPFVWYENAVHRSAVRDKLYTYINKPAEVYNPWSKNLIPKRSIPYYGGDYQWFFDFGSVFPILTNGTSLEFYPDEPFENFEIIHSEHYSYQRRRAGEKNILAPFFEYAIPNITPIVCFSTPAYAQYSRDGSLMDGSETKVTLWVIPSNLCADNISITFHFLRKAIICTDRNLDYIGNDNMDTFDCEPASFSFIHKTFEYNEFTRDSSPDHDTSIFKGQQFKWIDNPLYDPSCVDDPSDPNDFCPWPFAAEVDPAYPDTRIEMSGYLEGQANSMVQIQLLGWTIN